MLSQKGLARLRYFLYLPDRNMTDKGTNNGRSRRKNLFIAIYAVSFIVIIYFLVDGFSFYTTPYDKRPRHEGYGSLRPAGARGHAFGIIGTAMMIFMLFYSLRKRTRVFGTFGRLNHWLDVHIYFGVMGPILVILHTSFKVQGLVKVSFWSMIAVALSGVFGRYLYLQIPRDVQGESLSLQDLHSMSDQLTARLRDDSRLSGQQLASIEKDLSSPLKEAGGITSSLWAILLDDLKRPLRMHRVKKKYSSELDISPAVRNEIFDILLKKTMLTRRILFLNRVQQLFHYWHVFHKPFAVIMYIIMIVHVAVAVWLGYTWVF